MKFANTPIREVMNEVLRGTNLTYRLEKDVIVIYPIVCHGTGFRAKERDSKRGCQG